MLLTINQSDDPKLQAQTSADLNLLISALENPIFRSIVTIQDSLSELNVQLHQHPSILPVDFDINVAGELVLNLPPPIYYPATPTTNTELDDQRVPVAKLSQSSSGEPNSPPVISPGPEDVSLPPITTPTYALEFQKAIEESSQGRDVLTVKQTFIMWASQSANELDAIETIIVLSRCVVLVVIVCAPWRLVGHSTNFARGETANHPFHCSLGPPSCFDSNHCH
ncbi:hypothetical protein LSTR_LSTR007209 [Laodelphax striatellus]|uniref:L27 domain-containing protein n=1 Tax=Laodelphax striatellus TaxID=195883 RepID=A0A482XDS1_LAOST|nr:hypothetical protein LSTR_LSTR007209 [Laodelphax striatellus]